MASLIRSSLAWLALTAVVLTAPGLGRAQTADGDLLLILDASGSMWGQIGGEAKISIARRVLKDLASKIPAGTDVGLIAYGHRREGDCDDIETIVPIGPLDAAAIATRIDALNAKGKTPITKALQQAIDTLKVRDSASTVVLVSDGIETCGGDPCATVRAAKKAGVRLVLHVVGFDVGDVDVSQLECTAQAGGGLYFDAKNAEDLAGALDQALESPAPDEPAASLSVGATEAGERIDAIVTVTRTGEDDVTASGRTYTGAETNPRVFPLAPGTYEVVVTHLGIKGDAKQNFEGVEVREGELTEITADYAAGKLSIKATRNGELEDCTVTAYRAGTKEQVAAGRTYTSDSSNPKVLDVSPGTYDVVVVSTSLRGAPQQRLDGLDVRAGETTAREVDFSGGELAVRITRNGELADAAVTVSRSGTAEHVAGGRTYEKATSNPRVFEVLAGTYDVVAKILRVGGNPSVEFKAVEVSPGTRVDRAHDFATGDLRVVTTHDGKGWDATVNVHPKDDTRSGAHGRTYGKPKEFTLVPGEYEIVVRPLALEGGEAQTVDATITQAEMAEIVVDFP